MSTDDWSLGNPPNQQPAGPPPSGPQPFLRPVLDPVPWNRRALGWIVDFGLQQVLLWTGEIGFFVGYLAWFRQVFQSPSTATPTLPINALAWYGLVLASLIPWAYFVLYRRWIKGGKTGQSLGRSIARTRLVSAATGQPIGVGMTIVRDLAHTLDNLSLVGWLWPLWDRRRRTFADMLLGTVVVPEDEAPIGIVR